MLFITVSSNSNVSWATIPICARRSRIRASGNGTPSRRTSPETGVGESRNEIGQRALAAAVGPDQGDRLAGANPEIDPPQDEFASLIGEIDIVEDDCRDGGAAGRPAFRDRGFSTGGRAWQRYDRWRPRRVGAARRLPRAFGTDRRCWPGSRRRPEVRRARWVAGSYECPAGGFRPRAPDTPRPARRGR